MRTRQKADKLSNGDEKAAIDGPAPATLGSASARIRGGVAPRKAPRQVRSGATVAAILQAAAEVFAEHGYAKATTNRVAERAGVSVGSLYQYFPNKDSLLASLLERHHEDVRAVVDVALVALADRSVPLEEGLRRLVGGLVALHEAHPAMTRALAEGVLRESPAASAAHSEAHGAAEAEHVGRLLRARPDVRGGDHAAMAAIMGQAMGALTRWLVHDVPAGHARSVFAEEVVQLLLRYLGGPVRESAAT